MRRLGLNFLLGLTLCGVLPLESSAASDVLRVGVVEWLPLHAHQEILRAVTTEIHNHLDPSVRKFDFVSIQAFGDQEALRKKLTAAVTDGCSLFMTFGNFVTSEALATIADITVIGILIRDATAFAISVAEQSDRLVLFDADPPASMVWDLGKRVCPDMDTMGVLFTHGYAPNHSLVDRIRSYAENVGGSVYSATVGTGNCRTASDFEKALDQIPQSKGIDVLFLPEDPNGSRFAINVIHFATKNGWGIITSESLQSDRILGSISLNNSLLAHSIIESLAHHLSPAHDAPPNAEKDIFEVTIKEP